MATSNGYNSGNNNKYPGTAQIFQVLYSRKATNFKFSQGLSEQKSIKHFGKKRAWAYLGTAHFFSTPIISGMDKATNFKFCTHILSIDRNKTPIQHKQNNSEVYVHHYGINHDIKLRCWN